MHIMANIHNATNILWDGKLLYLHVFIKRLLLKPMNNVLRRLGVRAYVKKCTFKINPSLKRLSLHYLLSGFRV